MILKLDADNSQIVVIILMMFISFVGHGYVWMILPFDSVISSAETIASYAEISNVLIYWCMQMDL